MSSETILAITCAVIIGATALGMINKISRIFQLIIIVTAVAWEYWMLGL